MTSSWNAVTLSCSGRHYIFLMRNLCGCSFFFFSFFNALAVTAIFDGIRSSSTLPVDAVDDAPSLSFHVSTFSQYLCPICSWCLLPFLLPFPPPPSIFYGLLSPFLTPLALAPLTTYPTPPPPPRSNCFCGYIVGGMPMRWCSELCACPLCACSLCACPLCACPLCAYSLYAYSLCACPLCACPLCACPLCAYSLRACPLCACLLCAYSLCACPLCAYSLCAYSLCACLLCAYSLCACPLCACPLCACPLCACPL